MTTTAHKRMRLGKPGRLAVGVGGPLAIVALIVYVLASHGAELDRATAHLTFGTLWPVVLLAIVGLLARAEALVQGLAAMGERPTRPEIHASSSLTFVAMSVSHYVSSPVRAALLKRTDPERAPTIPEMIVVDTATTMIEALLVVGLILASAGTLKLPWWAGVAAVAAVACGFGLAVAARSRLRDWPGLRGLAIFGHPLRQLVITGLLVIVICSQIARTLIVLRAVGLDPSALQAIATFLTAGVLSTLFAGPSAGAAGAPLIVFGHRSIAAAGTAGLILSMTALLGALLYAAVGAPLYIKQVARARK